ncbi:MAG TPA: ABC transporter permease [Methylomusa anaerophila]|uniref:Putative aliphatic sulfonates transport permease protein SsuC n=1 Tax=Methylomusa anaerophila TaxID=1930071 RepID=A0A348AI63_9FIRM|nr:ABC transporter permease [Methylomusa anaerophila]BBB90761.1 putative aliphatic sulfonates transport permease protein SsuC [Methylomusa anaerophila]HML88636.1 ABC transporter permease [Methylomusa anaerophila]
MKENITAVHNKLLGFYLYFLVLILWEIAPRVGWASNVFLPPLSRVIQTAIDLGLANILIYVSISLKRVFAGFLFATLLALPVGFVLAGALPWLARFLRPLTVFLSSIPPFILFPIFVIIAGVGEGGIYTVIFWSSFWPILFTTIVGIQNVDTLLIRAGKAMNANKLELFFKVVLPGALPTIISGVRTGLTMSFFMLIGAESMGADSGMGWMIHNAQSMGFVERIYLGAILVAGVGFVLNYALEILESTVLYWREEELPEERESVAA